MMDGHSSEGAPYAVALSVAWIIKTTDIGIRKQLKHRTPPTHHPPLRLGLLLTAPIYFYGLLRVHACQEGIKLRTEGTKSE